MLTVRDLIEQFTIEGGLLVKTAVDDDGNYDVYFDKDNDHDLDGHDYAWMDKEIEYMYPIQYGSNPPQIVIEISK